MPAGAVVEVAMPRIRSHVLSAVVLLALVGAGGEASAQAGCQPTITQPCAPTPKPANQAAKRTGSSRADDSNEPKDHSPRIKIDEDTSLKFGTGGIGLGRKF
jgi:hypothetical protein